MQHLEQTKGTSNILTGLYRRQHFEAEGSEPKFNPGSHDHLDLNTPASRQHRLLRTRKTPRLMSKRWLQVGLGCVQLSPSCPFRPLHTFRFLRPARLRTPLLGYGAPHLSARGTSTLLNNALLSARFWIADHPRVTRFTVLNAGGARAMQQDRASRSRKPRGRPKRYTQPNPPSPERLRRSAPVASRP